jgi:hypothetical protein
MKTVRELADIIKVSKVSIYKALKRNDLKEHIEKRGNTTYIDETGEQLLINLFKLNSKVNSTVKTTENDEILFLREQNKMLTEKLAALADDLVKLNENNQTLLREHNLLKLPPPVSEKTEKIKFWNKLFKRKDKD